MAHGPRNSPPRNAKRIFSVIETPVLIVGGGPVGLSLAVELGWRGVPCILIEQSDGRIGTPKMNEVNVRTMEFCRRWGIADKVMSCPFPDDFPMDVAVVSKLGGYELGRLARPARKDQKPSPFSPMNLQVCSQIWFDPIMREKARSFPCVSLLYRHQLESFEADADSVTARVRDLENDREVEFRCQYLAGCDGAGSRIRRSLGINLLGSDTLSSAMHVYFRARDPLGDLGVKPGTFFAAVDETGYWGNIRAIDPANGLWRILFDVPPDFDPRDIDYDKCMKRAFSKPLKVEWVGASQWTRRGVVAETFSVGRVHLAGDAVHQLSPTGALGMNTGVADAVDLGWKLAAAYDGWAGPRLLESYTLERQPACTRNVTMATKYYEGQAAFREGLEEIDSPTAAGEAVRAKMGAHLLAHVTRMFSTIGLQIGYVYANSPICIGDDTPAPADDPANYQPSTWPGSRAPHVFLSDGRSTLDLFGRGFVLLKLGNEAPDTKLLDAKAAERGMPLQTVAINEPAVVKAYERRLVLVRPDGHVAWRGNEVPQNPRRLIDRVCGA
jgi:2-polyprenyl-6-methoxyphenol hydroxylase-like FAD-dependent oxidoreductase